MKLWAIVAVRTIKLKPTQKGGDPMAYTPKLSQTGSATLRRLAWYRGKPMSKTLEVLLEATGLTMAKVRPGEVCSKCRDKSICNQCRFIPPPRKLPPATRQRKRSSRRPRQHLPHCVGKDHRNAQTHDWQKRHARTPNYISCHV